jgi:glutamine amidotransferase
MKVLIIDYGMSNLGSVRRAVEECGGEPVVSDNPADLDVAERIILPGVGAFADGMANLNAAGWPDKLRETLANPEIQLLGICLGMQLLATTGFENGVTPGLNLIPGEVVKLQSILNAERIPHVGWNEVHFLKEHSLLEKISNKTDFYFVHSYHFQTIESADAIATTPYCGGFSSVVGRGNVLGAQFHPEKSSRPGFQILRNFIHR